jgi:hypothetical protein
MLTQALTKLQLHVALALLGFAGKFPVFVSLLEQNFICLLWESDGFACVAKFSKKGTMHRFQ